MGFCPMTQEGISQTHARKNSKHRKTLCSSGANTVVQGELKDSAPTSSSNAEQAKATNKSKRGSVRTKAQSVKNTLRRALSSRDTVNPNPAAPWSAFGGINVTTDVNVKHEDMPAGENLRSSLGIENFGDTQESRPRFGTFTTISANPMPSSSLENRGPKNTPPPSRERAFHSYESEASRKRFTIQENSTIQSKMVEEDSDSDYDQTQRRRASMFQPPNESFSNDSEAEIQVYGYMAPPRSPIEAFRDYFAYVVASRNPSRMTPPPPEYRGPMNVDWKSGMNLADQIFEYYKDDRHIQNIMLRTVSLFFHLSQYDGDLYVWQKDRSLYKDMYMTTLDFGCLENNIEGRDNGAVRMLNLCATWTMEAEYRKDEESVVILTEAAEAEKKMREDLENHAETGEGVRRQGSHTAFSDLNAPGTSRRRSHNVTQFHPTTMSGSQSRGSPEILDEAHGSGSNYLGKKIERNEFRSVRPPRTAPQILASSRMSNENRRLSLNVDLVSRQTSSGSLSAFPRPPRNDVEHPQHKRFLID